MKVVEEHGGAVEAVAYMKARLVESHRERVAKIERGEIKVVGQNCFTETEDSPLTAGADGGILTPDPEVERERRRGARALEGRARPGGRRAALGELAEAAARRVARTSCRRRSRPRRRAPRPASGPASLREVFGDYRGPDRGRRRRGRGGDGELLGRGPRAGRRGLRAARPPAAHPGRQAGPRRPLERRRADRRPRPRRRHGGDLPGDPPDARADRRLGARRGRRRGRPLDPLRLPPRAGPRDRRACCASRASTCRSWSAGSSRPPTPTTLREAGVAASTRPRTSTSTGSWARSPTWSASGPRPRGPSLV